MDFKKAKNISQQAAKEHNKIKRAVKTIVQFQEKPNYKQIIQYHEEVLYNCQEKRHAKKLIESFTTNYFKLALTSWKQG